MTAKNAALYQGMTISNEDLISFHDVVGATITGFVKAGFEPVREAFAANLHSGADLGASTAVFVDGECVVDLAGGYFDQTFTRTFGRDTLVNGFSSTKTMTALCALVLADRGELDLDAPVSKYWPEFKQNGKARALVRHIVGHTAGMSGWSEFMTLSDIYDREKSTAMLAAQAPWWKPGEAAGYHAFTMGHLVGEVVRRVTGQTLGEFFAREIAGPVGADYFIGTPAECDARVSPLVQGYPIAPNGNAFFKRALLNPVARPQDANSIAWRRADMGALNGHGSGRGIAAAQSVLACGSVGGKRLMSDEGRLRVLEQIVRGADLVLGVPIDWGVGYALNSPVTPEWTGGASTIGRHVAHWGGGGGSMSYVDLDARMSFGFAPNRWITGPHEQDRSMAILRAVYASLTKR
jgi:CubicO group peptidase (beta-lactamase class C family)